MEQRGSAEGGLSEEMDRPGSHGDESRHGAAGAEGSSRTFVIHSLILACGRGKVEEEGGGRGAVFDGR